MPSCYPHTAYLFRALDTGGDLSQRRDDGVARVFGHVRHIAPTRIEERSGTEVLNESQTWHNFEVTRVARRCDRRSIAAALRAWLVRERGPLGAQETRRKAELRTLARFGMRKLRAAVGRIRELVLRSRMRYPVGVPMALIVRDNLGLRDMLALDDIDDDEPTPGSAASRLPLLRKGVFLLMRHIDDSGGSKRTVPGRWKIGRVHADISRQQPGAESASLRRVVMVEEGRRRSESDQTSGDEVGDSTAFEFTGRASDVRRRTFRDVFPAPSRMHSSRMFVIEPEHLYHSAEEDMLRLSEAQTAFF